MLVTNASVGRVCSCHHARPKITRNSFLLSKNVCWCRLRMPLLAESVPATMLDPQALGTAFQKKQKKIRMELHILSFIEQCSGLQGRRRCLAAGVLDNKNRKYATELPSDVWQFLPQRVLRLSATPNKRSRMYVFPKQTLHNRAAK